jgi:hypothetical protein
MKTLTVILAVLPLGLVHGDIDRTMWKTPEEIDSTGSRELVAERGSAVQMRSLAAYRKETAACDHLPPDKAIPILGDAVFKLPKYNIYQLKERIEVFDLARDKLLSLPGHAEYFAEQVEKEREELQPGEYRGSYDRRRYWFLCETMRHLPSPETVRVLGRYLADDRDTYPPPPPGSDSGVDPPSSIIAMESLMLLGIRDAPYPPGRWYWYLSTKELEVVRQWFAPIKSGEKPFSFKGQSVEYRFNLDGTWTTTPIANPPDDAPKPVPPTKPPPPAQPSPPPLATPPPPPAQPSGLPWPWIGAGALLFIAALVRLVVLRGRRAG